MMCVACEEKREMEAKVERLKDQIRVLVEAMLNAGVDIPTGTYPINGPLHLASEDEAWSRANDEDHQP